MAAWPLYRALVGIGAVCAVVIVATVQLTQPAIGRNRAAALERAIVEVLPQGRAHRAFALSGDGEFAAAGERVPGDTVVHAVYDEAGALIGFAIPARGMGYQDTIEVLYAYAPQQAAIVGMTVLASRETPGLGDRIGTDEKFRANFQRLDVSLDASGQLAHPIVAVKSGEKSAPWQIDSISGATVSSQAIAKMLQDSAGRWVPLLARQREVFTWN